MNKRNTSMTLFLIFILTLMLTASMTMGVMAQDATATPDGSREAQPGAPTPTPDPPPHCPALEGQPTDVRTGYYVGEGIAYLQTNELSSAVFSFTCIIRVVDPSYLPAYMYRASAHARQRNFERAIDDYTSAIGLSANLSEAYNNRGVIYTTIGEYEEAAADFARTVQLDPAFLSGYNNQAVLHAINGNFDAAIEVLEGAIDRSGVARALVAYQDPERDPEADPIPFERAASDAYALLGVMYSAKSLEKFNEYMLLNNVNRYRRDERISSAAGALESRFTFEMRLDDGTWMTTVTYDAVGR